MLYCTAIAKVIKRFDRSIETRLYRFKEFNSIVIIRFQVSAPMFCTMNPEIEAIKKFNARKMNVF